MGINALSTSPPSDSLYTHDETLTHNAPTRENIARSENCRAAQALHEYQSGAGGSEVPVAPGWGGRITD